MHHEWATWILIFAVLACFVIGTTLMVSSFTKQP